MCVHACPFHNQKGGHMRLCCTPCSCGQNIEFFVLELHLSDCHRAGLNVPKMPINAPPPNRVSVPLDEIPVAA